jgi:transposase
VEKTGSKQRAALRLGCSKRSIDRYIAGYLAEGKAFFAHGNQGRQPANTIAEELAERVTALYYEKYSGASFAHYAEMLREREGISMSLSSIRRILTSAGIVSPQAFRKTKRQLVAKQKSKASHAENAMEPAPDRTVAPKDAHPRRPRSAYFGEIIQMDASLHPWFGDQKATLHIAVDDATGTIVGAWFDKQETLRGYYAVVHQILTNYGIPYKFYTDRRTVFEYRKSKSQDTGEDSYTQFGYACMQLGAELATTSVPQAKGRVERLISTMQTRLSVELRLEGIASIEQANAFLPRFVVHYNARFAFERHSVPSVFETGPSPEQIDRILAVVAPRTVDAGHSIRFENNFYHTVNDGGMVISFRKGTKGLVIRTFSVLLYFSAMNRIFALVAVPLHAPVSANFSLPEPAPEPRRLYIPPLTHPWKHASFLAFLSKQAARSSSN